MVLWTHWLRLQARNIHARLTLPKAPPGPSESPSTILRGYSRSHIEPEVYSSV